MNRIASIMAMATVESAAVIYYRSLTVDHTQVPSTQSNFPVLVNFTDATLKTLSNGGHVRSASGYDIGFFSDSAGTTPLKWEMDRYDATTGEVVAWVKIASVSSSSDAVFYMRYGDSSITTDQSDPVNVWSNSYGAVYHLGNGTTLSVNDSLAARNGTNHGTTAVAGQVDGGANFASASNQYIDLGSAVGPAAITLSCWLKATSFPNAYNSLVNRNNGSTSISQAFVKSSGKFAVYVAANALVSYDGTGSTTLSTGTWYYYCVSYDITTGLIAYVNASVDATAASNGNLETATSAATWIGSDPIYGSREWNGVLDEVRVSTVVRSANWITTEYNNQATGSTFVALGTETTASSGSSLLTGLTAYYALEDLTEEVGGLTLTNNNSATFGTGKVGDAVTVVASSSQYLSRADNAAFQMGSGTSFTIAAWIKTTDVDDFVAVAIYGQRGDAGYGFTYVSSTIRFFVGEGFPYNQATVDADTIINDGNWHLMVGTCNRSSQLITIYRDGSTHSSTPVSCSSIGSVNNTAGFKIGAHKATAADFWDGSVDELGIWNRVLTTGEIDALYNSGSGTTYPF